ncbi:MAG: tRNA (adenosine(37)-N6)-threonylcarbamoyltransferase complex dimerization subunit type 1 TsaB [Candidatus Omnitrophica bacterium]|nr:tRNA (adenosine(37)-N6)-threonylcarbamoyltransferase complex dimerization subunit type 1 TsaB [Candidatus Omnitrophota bacterium]
MKMLAIDTSTSMLSVALGEDGKLLVEYNLFLPVRHSTLLIPILKEVLTRCGITIEEIDSFALSIGPGSFTGLRVGAATVKGLAFAQRKPVVPVPSLDAIAFNTGGCEDLICSIVDAKQNKVYAALYHWKGNRLCRSSMDMLVPVAALLKRIRKQVLFIGDGIGVYKNEISASLGKKARFAQPSLWYPRASVVLAIAFEMSAQGKAVDVHSLNPVYLYPKECTIKKLT